MKTLKKIIVLFLLGGFLLGSFSCAVYVKTDNGKHKGWFKNPKNPHNPNYMDLGKSNGKHKK